MTLSWDPADERIVIEVFPYTEAAVVSPEQLDEDLEEPEPEEIFLVRLAAGMARAFVQRSARVIEAGRPPCPFCGNPLDPDGHLCVRANGFRRRDPEPDAMAELTVGVADLLEGDLELHGRVMPASNATFLGALGRPQGRLQAGRGGAAALGLPRRHPRRARGGGVRRLRGARLGRRPARRCCATDRTAPAWCRPGWSPTPSRRPSTSCRAGRQPDGFLHVFDGVDERDRPVSLVHEDSAPLRRMAVFDVLVNNADRKGGHVLPMPGGHRYGVDHGVSFHAEPKLRTVLWGWLGEPLSDEDLTGVATVLEQARDGELARAARRRRAGRPGVTVPPAAGEPGDARAARARTGHPLAAVLTSDAG